MTNCSKQEKIDFLKNMPDPPTLMDRLKYIKLVMLPRWYPFKNYDGGEVSTTMYLDVMHLYERFTDPEKFDYFEVTRLEELERIKKKHWKECTNCKKMREPEHFVSCYKTCLLCLDMTAEEAIEKFEKKKVAKDSGLKCSSCCSRKLLNEFVMKPDGTFMKTCLTCRDKKKRTPEMTPEPIAEVLPLPLIPTPPCTIDTSLPNQPTPL